MTSLHRLNPNGNTNRFNRNGNAIMDNGSNVNPFNRNVNGNVNGNVNDNVNGNVNGNRVNDNDNTIMHNASNRNRHYNTSTRNIVRRHPQLDPRITNTQLRNYRDPITLTTYSNLNYNDQRFLVRVNSINPRTGTVHSEVFDSRALLRMINRGNTRNPLTRNPFNSNQINNIRRRATVGQNVGQNVGQIVRRHPQLDPRITNTQLLNYRDPITLTDYGNLPYNDQRFLVLVNSRNPETGRVHSAVFDARALSTMLNGGHNRNPLTRTPFNARQITKIRRMSRANRRSPYNMMTWGG